MFYKTYTLSWFIVIERNKVKTLVVRLVETNMFPLLQCPNRPWDPHCLPSKVCWVHFTGGNVDGVRRWPPNSTYCWR
jgi:hypothetical protein